MAGNTEMTEAYEWRGRDVVDSDGDKMGTLDEIYLDQESGQPEWALVNGGGLFGSKSNFVPLQGASPSGEQVKLNYTKQQVKDAPGVEADGELSHEEEQGLYRHYGISYEGTSGSGSGDRDVDVGRDRDAGGQSTDDAMTRSEEELRVGTTKREKGRARLKKYVVTENVTKTVPVQREEVRIEREPITDANVGDAKDGPAITEDEHEVSLHEEEVVVDKQAVPKERVRLDKETVTEEETVSEEVRKEQIDTDADVDSKR